MSRRYVLGPEGARKLNLLIRGVGRASSVCGDTPKTILEDDLYPPFTVRWAMSVNDGSGSWIIWLPSTDALVSVDGVVYNPSEELELAGGDYPSGWYQLTSEQLDRDSGGDLYLNVGKHADGISAARFSASAESAQLGDQDSEDKIVSHKICSAIVEQASGSRKVKQYVSSAIISSTRSGGTGDGAEKTKYFGDIASISQHSGSGSDSGAETSNVFQLAGFGRYNLQQRGEGGSFSPSSTLTLEPGTETDVAVVVRSGNEDTVNGNTLQYKTLKISNGAADRGAFRIETRELGVKWITACYVNVGGKLKAACDDAQLSSVAPDAGFLAYSMSSHGFCFFGSLAELQDAQDDMSDYVVALYELDVDGRVVTDFRNVPHVQMFEEVGE